MYYEVSAITLSELFLFVYFKKKKKKILRSSAERVLSWHQTPLCITNGQENKLRSSPSPATKKK